MSGIAKQAGLARVRARGVTLAALLAGALAACGGGGGGTDPGGGGGGGTVVTNPQPLATGDRWIYRDQTGAYEQVVVEPQRTVGGVAATVIATTGLEPGNAARQEMLVTSTPDGLFELPDPNDAVTVALGSLRLLPPQLSVRGSSTLLERDVANGYDYDGDGRGDAMSVRVDQSVPAIEAITVPVGSFPAAARVRTVATIGITLSRTGNRVTSTTTVDEWYVADLGLVRDSTVVEVGGTRETTTRELTAYAVAGRRSDTRGPVLALRNPAPGTVPNLVFSVEVAFDEPVDAASVLGGGLSLRDASGGAVATRVVQTGSTRFTLLLDAPAPTGSYSVQLAPTVADLLGNTQSGQQLPLVVDRSGPAVASSTPADRAVDVALDATMEVVFDEDLDPATVNGANVELRGRFDQTLPATVSFVPPRTVRVVPQQALELGLQYTVWIGLSLRDTRGNGNANAQRVSFDTVQGQFASPLRLAGASGRLLAAGDVNGDGRPDLITIEDDLSNGSVVLNLYLQGSNGSYGAAQRVLTPAELNCGRTGVITVKDMNGDGRADLVYMRTGCGPEVAYQNASGGFDRADRLPQASIAGVLAADIDGDGRPDLVGTGDSVEVQVWRQLPGGGWSAPTAYALPYAGFGDTQVGDLNGDGRPDIVSASGGGGMNIIYQQPDGSFGPPQNRPLGGRSGYTAFVIADFNSDGRQDLLTHAPGSAGLLLFTQQTDGTLGSPRTVAGFNEGERLLAVDVNGDGRLDAVSATGGSGWGMVVYVRLADGSFSAPRQYRVGSNDIAVRLVAGDFNGDGLVDLAAPGPTLVLNRGAAAGPSAAGAGLLGRIRQSAGARGAGAGSP